eukprot:CAMPEP_0205807168 /NCGR_PEP_ID=MMETSP0205-20121125/10867_1 /ASSEMBLY_ACC=CAM_ASM_000278 /TAXON_ID=36767 /ORGANISM="Euplotes focardii, Strain TN1" /LENGTH=43 /DNA_ID= /DNA_START= /DNA_END= /DNA_ORIENTATION=
MKIRNSSNSELASIFENIPAKGLDKDISVEMENVITMKDIDAS